MQHHLSNKRAFAENWSAFKQGPVWSEQKCGRMQHVPCIPSVQGYTMGFGEK